MKLSFHSLWLVKKTMLKDEKKLWSKRGNLHIFHHDNYIATTSKWWTDNFSSFCSPPTPSSFHFHCLYFSLIWFRVNSAASWFQDRSVCQEIDEGNDFLGIPVKKQSVVCRHFLLQGTKWSVHLITTSVDIETIKCRWLTIAVFTAFMWLNRAICQILKKVFSHSTPPFSVLSSLFSR